MTRIPFILSVKLQFTASLICLKYENTYDIFQQSLPQSRRVTRYILGFPEHNPATTTTTTRTLSWICNKEFPTPPSSPQSQYIPQVFVRSVAPPDLKAEVTTHRKLYLKKEMALKASKAATVNGSRFRVGLQEFSTQGLHEARFRPTLVSVPRLPDSSEGRLGVSLTCGTSPSPAGTWRNDVGRGRFSS